MWNPRVFADDARGWQCPFVLCLPPQGCLRRGVRASTRIVRISRTFSSLTVREKQSTESTEARIVNSRVIVGLLVNLKVYVFCDVCVRPNMFSNVTYHPLCQNCIESVKWHFVLYIVLAIICLMKCRSFQGGTFSFPYNARFMQQRYLLPLRCICRHGSI